MVGSVSIDFPYVGILASVTSVGGIIMCGPINPQDIEQFKQQTEQIRLREESFRSSKIHAGNTNGISAELARQFNQKPHTPLDVIIEFADDVSPYRRQIVIDMTFRVLEKEGLSDPVFLDSESKRMQLQLTRKAARELPSGFFKSMRLASESLF